MIQDGYPLKQGQSKDEVKMEGGGEPQTSTRLGLDAPAAGSKVAGGEWVMPGEETREIYIYDSELVRGGQWR